MTDDKLRAALEELAQYNHDEGFHYENGPDAFRDCADEWCRKAVAALATSAVPALDEDRGPRLIKLPPVDDDNRCTGCGALVKRDGSCKCKVASDDR